MTACSQPRLSSQFGENALDSSEESGAASGEPSVVAWRAWSRPRRRHGRDEPLVELEVLSEEFVVTPALARLL